MSDLSYVPSDVIFSQFCCHLSSGEDEQLTLKLINRPMLILRGEYGFVCHHKNSNTLDASRSVYDIFNLQFSNGAYHIKGQNTPTPTTVSIPASLFFSSIKLTCV